MAEATAKPTITVAAPRSDPGRRTVVRSDSFRPHEHRSTIEDGHPSQGMLRTQGDTVPAVASVRVAPIGDTESR